MLEPGTTIRIELSNPITVHSAFDVIAPGAPKRRHAPTIRKNADQIKIVPNPFYAYGYDTPSGINKMLKIINLPSTGGGQSIQITMVALNGDIVNRFTHRSEGTEFHFRAANKNGHALGSGIYFVMIELPQGKTVVRKMIIQNARSGY